MYKPNVQKTLKNSQIVFIFKKITHNRKAVVSQLSVYFKSFYFQLQVILIYILIAHATFILHRLIKNMFFLLYFLKAYKNHHYWKSKQVFFLSLNAKNKLCFFNFTLRLNLKVSNKKLKKLND
jgi:hypothetical protein